MMTTVAPPLATETMNDGEEHWQLERRLAEQNIIRQSLEERDRRLWELQRKVEMLEKLLHHLSPAAVPQRAPAPSGGPQHPMPRRWRPR